MGLAELSNDQVHAVAAHLLVARIITETRLPVDLRAEQRRYRLSVGTRKALVQVFSKRAQKSDWQLSDATRPLATDTSAVVFMDLSFTQPECYIVPAARFREDVRQRYEAFLERNGKVRPQNPDSRHYAVQLQQVAPWLDCWNVLADL